MIIQLSNNTYIEDRPIIHNGLDKILNNPVLTMGLNRAGSLTFTIRPDDYGYDLLYPKITMIDIVDEFNGVVEWAGRVDECKISDIYGTKKVTCVGVMALLSDIYTILRSPDSSFITFHDSEEYLQDLLAAHKNSVYMHGGVTPLTLYIEADEPIEGDIAVYWKEGTQWKRGVLPVRYKGGPWQYFGMLYRGHVYFRYEGTGNCKIKFRGAIHGNNEKNMSGGSYLWKPSQLQNVSEIDISQAEPERNCTIHDYTYMTLAPNVLYHIHMTSDLFQFDTDSSIIQGGKTLAYPSGLSLGKTLDLFKYCLNNTSGQIRITRAWASRKLILYYSEAFYSNNQTIQLKRNLIDYNENCNYDDLFTTLLIYTQAENNSINMNSTLFNNMYVSDVLSRVYGVIMKPYELENTEDIEYMVNRIFSEAATNFLSISVKLFDESIADSQYDEIRVGDIVTIRTKDTEIEEVCTEIKKYLNEPEKNTYKFGVSPRMISHYINEGVNILDIATT